MVTARTRATYGLMPSVVASTSTGPGTSFPVVPTDRVAISTLRNATAAVATQVQAQGSLDDVNWYNLGAAQTYQSTGVSVYVSTGEYLASFVRANVSAHSSTGPITVSIAVK